MKAVLIATGLVLAMPAAAQDATPAAPATAHPAKIPGAKVPSALLSSPQASVTKMPNGVTVRDMLSMRSADEKFISGVYRVEGKNSFPADANGYAVDEFMYFIEGGVTLTSEDGTVTEVKAGDAVTIAKGWKGRWDSDGYTKYYVIYNRDGRAE
jgi:ethanolamine utilization protein EutQ